MLSDGIKPVVVLFHEYLRIYGSLQTTETIAQRKLVEHIFFKAVHKAAVRNRRKRQRGAFRKTPSFNRRFFGIGRNQEPSGKDRKETERQSQSQYLLEFLHYTPPSNRSEAARSEPEIDKRVE